MQRTKNRREFVTWFAINTIHSSIQGHLTSGCLCNSGEIKHPHCVQSQVFDQVFCKCCFCPKQLSWHGRNPGFRSKMLSKRPDSPPCHFHTVSRLLPPPCSRASMKFFKVGTSVCTTYAYVQHAHA